MSPFAHTQFHFTTGLPAGEMAQVRGANGEVLLTYRSFASIVSVVAALVSAIVAVAGLAAALLLVAEKSPGRAAVTLALTIAFTFIIGRLTPRVDVTLYDDAQAALTITQRASFPASSFIVSTPNGAHLAKLRKSFVTRLGRNRWTIQQDGRYVGDAIEESFSGALARKLFGKFSRRFETNVRVTYGGIEAGRIIRRPDAAGHVDILEVTSDTLDRRVIVAAATLILGGEP